MEQLYTTYNSEQTSTTKEVLEEYLDRGYKPIYVDIITTMDCLFYIEFAGQERKITPIPLYLARKWLESNGRLPKFGEIVNFTFYQRDGRITKSTLVVQEETVGVKQ